MSACGEIRQDQEPVIRITAEGPALAPPTKWN
jgi:hypothetical protein